MEAEDVIKRKDKGYFRVFQNYINKYLLSQDVGNSLEIQLI